MNRKLFVWPGILLTAHPEVLSFLSFADLG